MVINRRHFEKKQIVSSYDHTNLQKPEVMIMIKYRDYILDKHVLDIGCGAGRTTSLLQILSSDYTGIDYSYDMIESCKKKYETLHFIQGDVRNMGVFGNETYDFALFSFNGLDSIYHEDRLRGLQEIHRILKQDGLFVFSSHNRNFRNAISRPKMSYSLTPCIQVKNIIDFFKSVYNYSRNKGKQRFEEEYSIINDVAHNHSLLIYYIDKKSQTSQLGQTGFELIEMYDTSGNTLNPDSNDSDSAWIYYVARKKTGKSQIV